MTADPELIRLELDNQIAGGRAFVAGTTEIAKRYGSSFDTVAGLATPTCAAWDYPLFNRVIGAGILGPLDERGIDAIVRHFSAKGRLPCVEVYADITSPELLAALGRAGFTDSGHGLESHLLETDGSSGWSVTGATVRRVPPREYRHFGELVRDGFDMGADPKLGPFFADLTVASLEALGTTGAAFIASVDGEAAGTGELVLTARLAGCYSGSVLERFRGRGIQKALIAARVQEGLARGKRIFISQTDPDSPSGHNLHDVGFRTLYRASWFTRYE
jgi:GNAT superfamily N-acetyltransferase